MPVYRNHSVLRIAKSLNLFLNLEMGLTRGNVSNSELLLARAQSRIEKLQSRLAEKDRRLARAQSRIEKLQSLPAEKDRDPALQRWQRLGPTANVQTAKGMPASEREGVSSPIAKEFKKLEPWITRFVIDGVAYGGEDFDATNDARIDQFFESFSEPKRILELGSFEGGHTFRLASHPSIEHVVGIEGRQLNVERAKLVQRLLGRENIEFVQANLETTDLTSFGTFDVVFCSGLLYHLPRPWELVEQLPRMSSNVFIWTHYVKEDAADTRANGYEGRFLEAAGLSHPLGGMSPASFWPTLDGLHRMLKEHGFENIHLIQDDPDHIDGPAVTLAATTG